MKCPHCQSEIDLDKHDAEVRSQAVNDLISDGAKKYIEQQLAAEREETVIWKQGCADRDKLQEQTQRRCKLLADERDALMAQLLQAQAAIAQIKQAVCGDKSPNWTNDWQTTHTRGWIADICDSVDLSALDKLKAEGQATAYDHGWHEGVRQAAEVRKPLVEALERTRFELQKGFFDRDVALKIIDDALAKVKEQ